MCIVAKPAVIVVDPVSTGLHVAREVLARGFQLIVLHSSDADKPACIANMPADVATHAVAEIHHHGTTLSAVPHDHQSVDMDSTLHALKAHVVGGVLAGCETGVTLADHLSDRLGLTTNGASGAVARRNKYAMGECIRNAGLRAVKQCAATSWNSIVDFIEHDLKPVPFQVIVKPVESAGGDDVFLCRSMTEVKDAFDHIQGHVNQLGMTNMATLVQEYLVGTEYVVDTVTRHGVHKVVAMWEYEKGPANDAPFVYFAVRLVEATSPKHKTIMEYTLKVLDALHIRHGPAHAEVMWQPHEQAPCLVEVGARCHGNGGYFVPTVDRCLGYNQVRATVDCYFDPTAFASLPPFPGKLLAHGCEVPLVSYDEGVIETCPGVNAVASLASFQCAYWSVGVGSRLVRTIDVFTKPCSVWLLHASKNVMEADVKRLRKLERNRGLWTVQGEAVGMCPPPPPY
ncbi:hypothetical protein H257_08649 [Aphanomyces astaci]|uniref:ATP-grasp domain-containing protein n=2 Tax=Aphanomyces astaci TaxID=112090 RepID=W4GDP5_APHAT|nr:hypothetical protein H257_08649 [Aphanomyces astaci]ETV77817.1 hypothetical protein H257_08649 [Aphanomyces astaci]RHX97137.1 hypothetical protein DYB36_002668 [Aphanomyces astaci]|eukprot:XP_009832927.1 hypothetical protein H257_08649 [Aphanomyces astaci]